ncbi:MAG: GIY-YIG nuclease family protein [Nitrospina sp.]|nr:GIY-YIG nuclease family protein [Nitrospina sp.]
MKEFFIYILTNSSGTLYTGVTSNLERRLHEHRSGTVPGFTQRYRINRLVFFEKAINAQSAVEREKQIKGRFREKRIKLIESANPNWHDLSEDWF